MKQFGKPPFLREPHPLSTNPPISQQYFHDLPLCQNFKLGGGGNYVTTKRYYLFQQKTPW